LHEPVYSISAIPTVTLFHDPSFSVFSEQVKALFLASVW
jgi:hypothetical protein